MTIPDEGLAGRRVLITGASRGLGVAIARRFAAAGARVLTASRSAPPDDVPGTFLRADLATAEGVADLGERVLDAVGGVDVLVSNAGATSGWATALDRADRSWRFDLDINLLSAVRLDRALVPGMVERGSGVVLHVSSIASRLPQRGDLSYAAAKAALNAYSRGLAEEVGESGVRVLRVLPGFVATEGAVAHHQEMADEQGVELREMQRRIAGRLNMPMGRPGDPEDAAELIAFLASERAKWLTGAEYRVDGGIIAAV
ncbi:oxidoreductase [Saccharopolyspora sp. NPDC047091]|uniref:oxidoreductase n=1 Tax=Saccharopolyspora sp. NPDC047091 TaxID=3155924 RepID=UPI00340F6438